MRLVEGLVQTSLAQALGYALLHFVWEGIVVAMLLRATLALVRLSAARVRYAISCAALAVLPVVFAITFWQCFSGQTPRNPLPLVWTHVNPRAPATGSGLAPGLQWEQALAWLAPLWMAGVLAVWARVVAAWLLARRLRRVGVCAVSAEWQRRLEAVKQRMRMARPIVLLESCLTEVPLVVGWLRPVVLLPAGLLTGFPGEHVEAFLIHELAHIRRWDYLVNLAQAIVEGLLFYHPAAWWVSRTVRREREHCCDDEVVALTGDARGYAVALTTFEEERWTAVPAANGGDLVRRIHRLLGTGKQPVTAGPIFGLLLVALLSGLGGWHSLRGQARVSPQAQEESPYEKWVNEDVAYIITPAERAAFERLETNAEREQFIEQFWLRRDPTPGTPRNEAKEGHYRRIGYANGRFGFPGMAGWRTDRGRIYITFGPPDELDQHPSGGVNLDGEAVSSPFEYWRYRFIAGIGNDVIMEFVDSSGTGNYQMTKDPAAK
jgi:GWxTD domain-containing protein